MSSDPTRSREATRYDGRNAPLTEKQQRLVTAIVEAASRGNHISREAAGTAAGYGKGDVARVSASRSLGLPAVRQALMVALRDAAQVDAAGSYATLRWLERRAPSHRVRLDASLAGLRVAGLDQGGQAQGGGGVAIQIVFRHVDGTTLAQPAQVVDVQGVPAIDRSLVEGGAEASAITPRPRAQAKPSGGASKTSARSLKPGSTHDEAPKNSARKKSPGRKSRVKVKRSVWTDEQRAAARDRSLRLHEARRAAAGLKVGGDE